MGKRTKEELLVIKAQQGDKRAFGALYRAYQPSLVRFAYRLCTNDQMAFDAVQEAWITTARTISDLYNPAHFRARIFKAVRWRCLDALRKQQRNLNNIDVDDAEIAAPERPFWATQGQIIALIAALPAEEQQAIYLYYLEELKVEEIAAVMEIPAGTVKSRLNRARNRLKQKLEGEENAIN